MREKAKSAIVKVTHNDATNNGVSFDPAYINYFLGKNGTEKSTIAKAIARNAGLKWRMDTSLDVYNILLFDLDFIENNFRQYGSLLGVFTIHEQNILDMTVSTLQIMPLAIQESLLTKCSCPGDGVDSTSRSRQ